jgi:hemolysin activation/secretion protein
MLASFKAQVRHLLLSALMAMTTFSVAAVEDQDTASVTFDIVRFKVEGNSLLPVKSIDAALAPFTGTKRGFADVERAVQALQEAYHRRGFKLVQVVLPEQE